jgi:integrase
MIINTAASIFEKVLNYKNIHNSEINLKNLFTQYKHNKLFEENTGSRSCEWINSNQSTQNISKLSKKFLLPIDLAEDKINEFLKNLCIYLDFYLADLPEMYCRVGWFSFQTYRFFLRMHTRTELTSKIAVKWLLELNNINDKATEDDLYSYLILNLEYLSDTYTETIHESVMDLKKDTGLELILSAFAFKKGDDSIDLKNFENVKKKVITVQISVDESTSIKILDIINKALSECLQLHLDETETIPDYSVNTGDISKITESDKVPGNTITLKELIEKFTDENISKKKWSIKLKTEMKSMMDVLIELLGNEDISEIKYEMVFKKVFKQIQKIPPNYKKKREYKGKSLLQILKMSESDRKCIGSATINKYMYWYSALFAFAVKRNYITDNPFLDMKIKVSKGAQEQRDPFSKEDIIRLFKCPLYNREADPNRFERYKEFGDSRYWVILLGLFTGMRLGEICQAGVDDIVTEQGIDCIKVRPQSELDKKVKSKAGIRMIPLHPDLKDLGFLKFVENLKTKNIQHLFPEFKKNDIMGWSHSFTGFFKRVVDAYLKEYFKEGEKKTFHSLRHNFSTCLKHNGVDLLMIDELTGHSSGYGSESIRYSKSYTIIQKQEAIEKLDYGIDIKNVIVIYTDWKKSEPKS